MTTSDPASLLRRAAAVIGVEVTGASVIRLGENAIYRLPGGIVARVARSGQQASAAKEVAVARWLADSGVPAVRPLPDAAQPVVLDGRAVTFWHELPQHQPGSVVDVAAALRHLHGLQPPLDMELPALAPLARVAERIEAATTITPDDRRWLSQRLSELAKRFTNLPAGLPACVVHGDAWPGNIVRTATGVVLLDLERCAVGPPEWDLTPTAVDHVTTAWLDPPGWSAFCRTYGHDVTGWEGFPVLRDIRELRWTTFAVQMATTDPQRYLDQATHRLACIRDKRGPRPWSGWTAVP